MAQLAGRSLLLQLQSKGKPRPLPALVSACCETPIEASHLHQYQRFLGLRVSSKVPIGLLHALSFPRKLELFAASTFPLPALGMVHIRNQITQFAQLTWPATITSEARVQQYGAHKRGTTVAIETRIMNGETLVMHEVSTYLAKGIFLTQQTPEPAADKPQHLGAPQQRWRITPADVSRYAKLAGDFNPIHTSTLAAKAFGFRTRIAHGMYLGMRCFTALAERGDTFSLDLHFAAPAFVPSILGFSKHNGTFQLQDVDGKRHHLHGSLRSLTPAQITDRKQLAQQSWT